MTDESQGEKTALLGQSSLFSGLDGATVSSLASRAYLRKYKANDLIFRAGSQGDSMMVIAQGVVRIIAMSPTARDVILTEFSKGEVFGEIAFLDGRDRTADARAQTNCELLVLERRALLQIMRTAPDLAINLLEILCSRLRRSNERLMEFAFLQLAPRLARTILDISSNGGRAGSQPIKRLTLPQSDLANMVGSSRENVNRCLRKWQQDGLIDLTESGITLLDRAGLQRAAEAD